MSSCPTFASFLRTREIAGHAAETMGSFWRAEVTRRWPYPAEKPIWQRDFFDRQLRNGESYHQKCFISGKIQSRMVW